MDGEEGHHIVLGSSELSWADGEVQGDEAERLGSSEGRGSGSGGNYGDRRRGTRSAIAGESEGDEGGRVREDERGRGGRVASLDVSMRRQKQEVAGVWPRAPATRSASFWCEEDDDWQGQSVGPSQVGWPAQVRPRWASLSLLF